MGRLTVRLPDALHRQLENLARDEGVSLNQYLVYALTRQATLDAHTKKEHAEARQRTRKSAQQDTQAAASEQNERENLLPSPSEDFPPPSSN